MPDDAEKWFRISTIIIIFFFCRKQSALLCLCCNIFVVVSGYFHDFNKIATFDIKFSVIFMSERKYDGKVGRRTGDCNESCKYLIKVQYDAQFCCCGLCSMSLIAVSRVTVN